MSTSQLRSFAIKARSALLSEVESRVEVVLAVGSNERLERPGVVAELEDAISRHGKDSVIDRVAYMWFNRLVALRFMDVNRYTGMGVVSPAAGLALGQPEVLSEAKGGAFDEEVIVPATAEAVTGLLSGKRQSKDPQGEAYGLLVEAYCRHWNSVMPYMFQAEGDFSELLMPTSLLSTGSIRDALVEALSEEACQDVEVIGWLYQYYISDVKNEVFEGFKKNKKAGAEEIPPATQIFTPHWIVRYLVENSVGRLWLLNNPDSGIRSLMDYYVESPDVETDFLQITSPEELTVMDPAVGSGHMLTYAFDLLYAIYEEEGYNPSDIPTKIIEKNLFGLELDPRAGALAAFALTMKASQRRRVYAKNPSQPNITVLTNMRFDDFELDYLWSISKQSDMNRADFEEFWNSLDKADVFGSLISPDQGTLNSCESQLAATDEADLVNAAVIDKAKEFLRIAGPLARTYATTVANPPYMGSKNFSSDLKDFAATHFREGARDLCTMFILRALEMTRNKGLSAIVASESWLFTNSFSSMRKALVSRAQPEVVACLDRKAFGVALSTAATVLRSGTAPGRRTRFFRVLADDLSSGSVAELPPREAKIWDLDVKSFDALEGRPFVFDYPEALLALGQKTATISQKFDAKQGLATADNAQFVRCWWELDISRICRTATNREEALHSGAKWFPYNKGGTPVAWWGSQELVVNWENDGKEIREFGVENGGRPRSAIRNPDFYFRPSVTWSNIGIGGARFRVLPAGFIFDVGGMSLFSPNKSSQLLLAGLLNSVIYREGLNVLAPTFNYQVGDVGRLPAIEAEGDSGRVQELVDLCRSRWAESETAHEFASNPLLDNTENSLEFSARGFASRYEIRETRILDLESESNRFWLEQIETQSGVSTSQFEVDRAEMAKPDPATFISDFVSYAVGCMFGRYSLDLPGLVLGNADSSLEDYLSKVPQPTFFPDRDNVLPIVDGEWFEDDIVGRFRKFLRAAFGEKKFEENLQFVIDSLGVKDLRTYFLKSFYKDHVSRYQRRPIYWLFSSPKGSFNALIYMHRYNSSTVSTVLNEYVREFAKKIEVNLEHNERISTGVGNAREIAAAQKEADRLRRVMRELEDYAKDLYALASKNVNIDLDDGVAVNYMRFGSVLKNIGLKKASND